MNDDALDYILNSISALGLNRPEVSNDTQNDFNNLISKVVKQQLDTSALEKDKVKREAIATMGVLESNASIRSAIGATRVDTYADRSYGGYTTSINNEIGTNQSYFGNLIEKPYIDKKGKASRVPLDHSTRVKRPQ